jgi:excisionase family DNA binding protein
MDVSAKLLTIGDVADLLNASKAVVHRLAILGELVAVRVGRELRFQPEEVASFIERHRLVVQNDDDPVGTGSLVRTSGVETAGHEPD